MESLCPFTLFFILTRSLTALEEEILGIDPAGEVRSTDKFGVLPCIFEDENLGFSLFFRLCVCLCDPL